MSVVPVQMIENPDHANPEYLVDESEKGQEIRRIVYSNPKYVKLLKEMLPKIIKKGVLGQAESHFWNHLWCPSSELFLAKIDNHSNLFQVY